MASHYVIRYGLTRQLGSFTWKSRGEPNRSDNVIVKTRRGLEWGEVLCESNEQTKTYLENEDTEGKILRLITIEDYEQQEQTRSQEQEKFDGCKEVIHEMKLPMQLVDVEQLFGGERAIFYFLSDNRVDFRELVKTLAKKFQIRIEMRQIGVRDEAKLLADYGDCGKPVCCNTHLQEMPPVSMKMAKVQRASLDPNKISGRCGRLKCCLRYEYDVYKEYRKDLPAIGAAVVTSEGTGKVIGQEILAKKVVVSYPDHRRVLTDLGDILSVSQGGPRKKPELSGDETIPVDQLNSEDSTQN